MAVIEVICRKCGRKAPAEEFRVDHVYKLAVCKVCYTDRKKDLPKKPEEKIVNQLMSEKFEEPTKSYEIRKSKILDDDDDYLERAVHRKKEELKRQKENSIRVRPYKDNKVIYTCPYCTYKFKYNVLNKTPTKCPYCAKNVNHNINF